MTDPQQAAARKLLARITKVRPIRESAQRVMVLSAEPNASIARVAQAVAVDSALAAETMRVANSAVFRRGPPVDDLHRAVMTLGLELVHAMATSMAMMGSLLSASPQSRRLQARALLAAAVAGLLATASGKADKGAAFLAGLLGEIGAMACLSVDHPYALLLRQTDGDPAAREAQEVSRYGMPSRLIGGQLLRRNDLPEPVCEAVEASWDQRGQYASVLVRIAVFGRRMAPTLAHAVEHDALASIGPEVERAAIEAEIVQLSPERLVSLCNWAAASGTSPARDG